MRISARLNPRCRLAKQIRPTNFVDFPRAPRGTESRGTEFDRSLGWGEREAGDQLPSKRERPHSRHLTCLGMTARGQAGLSQRVTGVNDATCSAAGTAHPRRNTWQSQSAGCKVPNVRVEEPRGLPDYTVAVVTAASESAANSPEVEAFVRRAIGVRFEMRFKGESQWWPVDAREVAETLAGYYYDYGMHSCLEMMREGKELPTALAFFRIRG